MRRRAPMFRGRQYERTTPNLKKESPGLTQEGREAQQEVLLSLIHPVVRRSVAVFLGTEDYAMVEQDEPAVIAGLLMECLPKLIKERGGEIVIRARFDGEELLNPAETEVKVSGETRRFVIEGYLFINMPGSRLVVSVEPNPHDDSTNCVTVRTDCADGTHADFYAEWKAYAREHNFLRGQAFFADGDVIARSRKYSWDDILLAESVKSVIRMNVEGFLRNRLRLRELGAKARRGLILEGPPGTGKTLLGKILAEALGTSFMWASPRHIKNPESFSHMMNLARFVSPTVVFIEDLDLFAEDRNTHGWMGLGELMNQLDGALDNEDIITIATTNHVEVVEEALRARPGRFDRIVNLGAMDEPCRKALVAKVMRRVTLAPEDVEYIVKATESYTGAQIEELANTIFIHALETGGQDAVAENGPVTITRAMVDGAFKEMVIRRESKAGFRA